MAEKDAQASALVGELERILLAGPRARITEDVTQWAEQNGRNLAPERLLDAYNDAVLESDVQAKKFLRRKAADDNQRAIAMRLLNFPGATDRHRTLVLEALRPELGASDIPELARVSARQRAAVLPLTIEVLGELATPEASFVLRRLLAERDPGAAQLALEASRDSLAGSTALKVLRGADSSVPPSEDLLFAAMTLDRAEQAGLTDAKEPIRTRLADAADTRDRDLVERGRTSSGLSDYESLLRRELHLLVALALLDVSPDLEKRARDTLLTTDHEIVERDLAEHLDGSVLAGYASRAITADNRRRRPERAKAALRMLRHLPAAEMDEIRDGVRSSLRDGDPEIRFESAAALTATPELTDEDRAALVKVSSDLPIELRERLAPQLGAVGEELAEGELEELAQWAAGAPAEEAAERLSRLLDAWESRAETVNPDLASSLIAVAGRLFVQNRLDDRTQLDERIVECTAAWLRSQGGTARATRALLSWSGFRQIVLEHFPGFAEYMNAKAARRLLRETLRSDGVVAPDLFTVATRLSLSEDREQLVLRPELEEALYAEPNLLTEAGAPTSVLLEAAVLVLGRVGRELAELAAATAQQSTEALVTRRAQVLAALDSAERDSSDNKDLRAQLALVRRALRLSDPREEKGGPTPEVIAWREKAMEEHPELVKGPAGGEMPVEFREGDLPLGSLSSILVELDRRVNARGIVPAEDRVEYASDLQNAVQAFVVNDGDPQDPQLDRLSNSLRGQLEWEWALRLSSSRSVELLEHSLADTNPATSARIVAVIAQRSQEEEIRSAVEGLDTERLSFAARTIQHALISQHSRLRRVRVAQRSQEARAMGEIADSLRSPFQAIESYLFSYFRLRAILEAAGWEKVTPHLGEELARSQLSPDRFSVRGDDERVAEAERFLVRSLGVEIAGDVVQPAVVEPVSDPMGEEL